MASTSSRYTVLQTRAAAFSAVFLDLVNNPPDKILSDHFTTRNPRITEHGPKWASKRLPFLAGTFSGRDGCLEYFENLGKIVEVIPTADSFGPKESFIVDPVAVASAADRKGMVSIRGKFDLKCLATGKTWYEEFILQLSDFDEEGKIGHLEIWADPLSAWAAFGTEDMV